MNELKTTVLSLSNNALDWLPVWFQVLIYDGTVLVGLTAAGKIANIEIHAAKNKNRTYEAFATQHGGKYDKAQAGNLTEYSKTLKSTFKYDVHVLATKKLNQVLQDKSSPDELIANSYIDKYVPFLLPPFQYVVNRRVANIVTGEYLGYEFMAYTHCVELRHWASYEVVATRIFLFLFLFCSFIAKSQSNIYTQSYYAR